MFFAPRVAKTRENTTYLTILGHYGTEKKRCRGNTNTTTTTTTNNNNNSKNNIIIIINNNNNHNHNQQQRSGPLWARADMLTFYSYLQPRVVIWHFPIFFGIASNLRHSCAVQVESHGLQQCLQRNPGQSNFFCKCQRELSVTTITSCDLGVQVQEKILQRNITRVCKCKRRSYNVTSRVCASAREDLTT